jgi:hypothetical protein
VTSLPKPYGFDVMQRRVISVRMLTYFPSLYPGELLYSAQARYGVHFALSSYKDCFRSFFGAPNAIATYDLPNRLDALAVRLHIPGLTGEKLVQEATMFPYYVAWRSAAFRQRIESGMCGHSVDLHVTLGLTASRVPREKHLKFCPECLPVMRAEYQEAYWRRDHQPSSVLVCPDHGCPLRISPFDVTSKRFTYVPADEASCPDAAVPACRIASQSAEERFLQLAKASAALLERLRPPCELAALTAEYRIRLLRAGLIRGAGIVHRQRLMDAMQDVWGTALEQLPGVLDGDRFAGHWLFDITRKPRRAFHPLYHLLFEGMLGEMAVDKLPFGDGPWPCLNPLADHYRMKVVRHIERKRMWQPGHMFGVFTCECGYIYGSRWSSERGEGRARARSYGPLLEPELRRLIASGATRRKAALALKLDATTVGRLADRLGIPNNWPPSPQPRTDCRLAANTSPTANDRQNSAPVKRSAKGRGRPSDRSLKDWTRIDCETSLAVRHFAAEIRIESPPVRVTIAELERRLGHRGLFRYGMKVLPLSAQTLCEVSETVEAFQVRRMCWHIAALSGDGRGAPPAWQVIRDAGLPQITLPRVRRLIDLLSPKAPALPRTSPANPCPTLTPYSSRR